MEENKKKPWLSKTLWVNALVAVASFFPSVKEIVSPDNTLMLLAFINVVLRLVTKDKISLED